MTVFKDPRRAGSDVSSVRTFCWAATWAQVRAGASGCLVFLSGGNFAFDWVCGVGRD
jgi:hypothetical protein